MSVSDLPPRDPLSRGLSLYLEALRIGAALAVFLTHLSDSRLTGGRWEWFLRLELGRDAVVVFFVLSGLIVARAAGRSGVTGRGFVFDRLTRLWSVALPALVLGWLLDRWGVAAAPWHYAEIAYQEIGLARALLLGATFSSEWLPFGELMGSNLPYWSLSYEAAYYALFACAVFLEGRVRIVALAIGLVAMGPGALALLPAWALGVWVWSRLEAGDLPKGVRAWAMALGPVLLIAPSLWLGLGPRMAERAFHLLGPEGMRVIRFGFIAPWALILAGLTALHLLGVAALLRDRAVRDRPWLRWAAGGTFSLYVVHQPVLHALRVRFDGMGETLARDAALALATLTICLVFAALFERTLGTQRRALRALVRRSATQGA
ncbi:acyltransferase family protein [Jannaschia seohaensis]|uniref:Peptidoglycan/LPS O-acetylase OafA/YrhL n=1 Tax=Jannaschia seohaensis TaxID=475081 RepID=A0A2Y9B045_9RHOB|nr:acyltransferase [Jannaschia seohaensis]PWJ15031.1 peptidoglycan/LPS O-acetylase OafA/YrhL [Jannaschia seohaensis]SSA49880.1 Peptidoglycan/LPS O-acetylase OafA/YrhL, contains acyltransferase and SGNH-hydrolase domains [Jannaschia seohaensis]